VQRHWKARRDPEAKMLSLQSFLWKGVSLGHIGRNSNLEDLKAARRSPRSRRGSILSRGVFIMNTISGISDSILVYLQAPNEV
jgi:hypothetical protein